MYFILLLPLFVRFVYVRVVLVLMVVSSYLLFGPKGTDIEHYLGIYEQNLKGVFVKGIEPGFQVLSYGIGQVTNGTVSLDGFLVIIAFTLLVYIYNQIKKNEVFDFNDYSYVIAILSIYIITYQLAFNYRTGIATLLFISGVLSRQIFVKILFYSLSTLTHIQSVVACVYIAFRHSTIFQRLCVLLALIIIVILKFEYFYSYIYVQGSGYLVKYTGSIRLAVFVYLPIYMFICFSKKWDDTLNIKPIIFFGMMINIFFIFNSHISSRLTRPIEPLLFIALYQVLGAYFERLSKSIRFIIAIIPGLFFFTLEQYILK